MSARIATATVRVDCGAPRGPVRRIWTSLGFDEINWTSRPAGQRHLRTIGAFAERPYYVRSHYIFNSGIGWSLPHWGAGNVYHEDAAGRPFYDFSIADEGYDAVGQAGDWPPGWVAVPPRGPRPPGARESLSVGPGPRWTSCPSTPRARDSHPGGCTVRSAVRRPRGSPPPASRCCARFARRSTPWPRTRSFAIFPASWTSATRRCPRTGASTTTPTSRTATPSTSPSSGAS